MKFFDPQNLKKHFFLKILDKINNFRNFQKTEKKVLDIHLTSSPAKFQLNISIRGLHIARKPYPLMTLFFKLQFWAFLDVTQKFKLHFWNPEVKLTQKHAFFIQKYQFKNLTYHDRILTWRWFAWSDRKMTSILEFYV